MANCHDTRGVLWLDEWFALDSAVASQANQWVLPSARYLRTNGARFVRVNARITVVSGSNVDVVFESSNDHAPASAIALSGGAASPTTWASVGSYTGLTRTIHARSDQFDTSNGLRDFLRVVATNLDSEDLAIIRLEIWVTMGN
jgi:hypothetical protein